MREIIQVKEKNYFIQAQAVIVTSDLIALGKESTTNHEAAYMNCMKCKQETTFAFIN